MASKQAPIHYADIKDGKLRFYDRKSLEIWLDSLDSKQVEVTIVPVANRRTNTQNNALHLYFTQLADAFNEAGLDMRKVLKESVEIEWTAENVKNYLWRPVQQSLTKKESTTELDKHEDINRIYENLNRHLSQKFGVSMPFPSIENFEIKK